MSHYELINGQLTIISGDQLQPGSAEDKPHPSEQSDVTSEAPAGIPQDFVSGRALRSCVIELTASEVASNIDTTMEDPAVSANNGDDDPNTSKLDPRKMTAALALSIGQTETEVAKLVAVNRSTIYRWQQEAEFAAELNRLRREYLKEQRSRLHALLHQSIRTLESCLDRKDLDMIKLKAAMFIVSHFAPRAHETIGPITERGVQKAWKDEALRLSSSDEVHLLRVTEP